MAYAQAALAYSAMEPALISPTRAEAQVFLRVTRRLHAVFSNSGSTSAERASVLHDNRRLWLAAATQVADDANIMPDDLRASIISLAGYVDRQTSAILRGEAKADGLIEVNTRMARGLSGEVG